MVRSCLGMALCLAVACVGPRQVPGASPSLEGLLWGGGDCRQAHDCASGLCIGGSCVGYLGAPTEDAREEIGPILSRVSEMGQGEVLREALEAVLRSPESDEFIRGRAADAFRWLPAEFGGQVLREVLEGASEPVRFFAARALHSRGVSQGTQALEAFRRHSSEAVRRLAERALQGPTSQ